MKLVHPRFALLVALCLLVAAPSFAGKRRAVGKPSLGNPFTATISGTVTDAQTGQPVAFASITLGDATATARPDGTFELRNVSGFGSATVTASRSGYNSQSLTINGSGTFTLNFQLQGRPTVTLRMTNGTVRAIDDDTVRFGYVVLFGGYVASDSDDFCRADGTAVTYSASQMRRIAGPSTMITNASCCSRQGAQLQQVRIELRTGESADVTFRDSCDGYAVDFLGRDHVTGGNVSAKFSEIAEVVFP